MPPPPAAGITGPSAPMRVPQESAAAEALGLLQVRLCGRENEGVISFYHRVAVLLDLVADQHCALHSPQGRPGSPAVDDWEIDITQLQIDAKVASGAFSNLYRGSYCGQEVAVKILKDVQDDTSQYQEFLQVRGGCSCREVAWASGRNDLWW